MAFGTVKLTLLNDSADTPFVVTKAKPGATVFEADELCFENSGNLDAVLRLQEHERLAWLFWRTVVEDVEPAGVI